MRCGQKYGYPERLMPKLVKRERNCRECLETDSKVQSNVKLSFEPNEKYPSMANVLEVGQDGNGGYSVVAKADIDVGKTILVERPFLAYLNIRYGCKCNICLKSNVNLVPCPKCSVAMFCHKECQGSFLHEYECGVKFMEDIDENISRMSSLRLMLLKKRLAAIQTSYPFLKLRIGPNVAKNLDFPWFISNIYNLLIEIPKIKAMFQSMKHRRFLMHLIGHHALIVKNNNCHSVMTTFSPQYHLYKLSGITANYFKSSCLPNVFVGDCGGNLVGSTIRPVKKGEHLLTAPIPNLMKPKSERQHILWIVKQITCKCVRCEGHTASPEQCLEISLDPSVYSIRSEYPRLNFRNVEEVQAFVKKCGEVLTKYGHIMWCHELGMVLTMYMSILSRQSFFLS
ncbi:uncharacterized protein LOC116346090 [Contarinia nasturtii]|uniref:uncharacterized protein LOC116346090 n=1 Tax=Contarinia nasturtii TaxID=265458 RepID=UPI0012D44CD7|nr:uncharacterized protein LOC116346090 [Contarinia nasturtii]